MTSLPSLCSRIPLGRCASALSLLIVLTGCATVQLPRGPDVTTFARRGDAPTVVVLRPVDQRANQRTLGTIGLAQLSLREDPTELIAKQLIAALHVQGVNGIMSASSAPHDGACAEAAQGAGVDGVLATTIQWIAVESFDALLDRPTARVGLKAVLHNCQGIMLQQATVTGEVRRFVNTLAMEQAVGRLVAEAAQDAADRLMKRSALVQAIRDVRSEHAVATDPGISEQP